MNNTRSPYYRDGVAINVLSSRRLGKYAGTCSACDLMRGTEDGESVCPRCGHVHESKAVAVAIAK